MRGLRGALAGLTPPARWAALGLGALVVLLLLGVGGWALLGHWRASAERAFAEATSVYVGTLDAGGDARLETAAKALRDALGAHPRSAAAAAAWFALGNVEYRRKAHDAALEAYQAAAARNSGTVGALARLGIGYTWEARGDAAQALGAYRAALADLTPRDFLYGELLLATARVQETLQHADAAVQAYRRLLKDLPESPRAPEVRLRLALLGAGA